MSESAYEQLTLSLYGGYQPHGKEWLYADEDGWTIAHQYARHHVLPLKFPHWEASDNMGWSVAHQAAAARKLPKGFSLWWLQDHCGDTVLHIALRNNLLPDTLHPLITYQATSNKAGQTILEAYAECVERLQASLLNKT